jgi:hypothetical protein
MASTSLLEDITVHLSANVFTRAFSFSSAQLPLPGTARPHLAERLVLIGGMGFILQVSEYCPTGGAGKKATDLKKWLADDIRKKAVKQIGRTRDLLRNYFSLSLVNARGHRVLAPLTAVDDLIGLIVYRAPSKPGSAPPRFAEAPAAGFVHIMSDTDYFGICEYLVTPCELIGYLRFRQGALSRPDYVAPDVSETALLGQYLFDDLDSPPHSRYEAAVRAFSGDPGAFAFAYVIENLGTQMGKRDEESVEAIYHPILVELARLGRIELRELKTQLRCCLDAVRADRFELPYRLCSAKTQCAFLVLPGSVEFRLRAREALDSLATACKHELQIEKQVSIAMWRSGEIIDIDWMYTEGPAEPNEEMDKRLARAYPFRKSSQKRLPEYFL